MHSTVQNYRNILAERNVFRSIAIQASLGDTLAQSQKSSVRVSRWHHSLCICVRSIILYHPTVVTQRNNLSLRKRLLSRKSCQRGGQKHFSCLFLSGVCNIKSQYSSHPRSTQGLLSTWSFGFFLQKCWILGEFLTRMTAVFPRQSANNFFPCF